MNWQDVIKPLSLTPATESHDSPFDKGYTRVAGTCEILSTYLQVPANIMNDVAYERRLMFQFNYTFTADFYLVNIKQLMNFGSMYMYGGCLCIKWRAGTKLVNGVQVPNVLRYCLLDYRSDLNWSLFPVYTNQLIKKNFCLEFWTDTPGNPAGISQDLFLQTGLISIPASVDDGDFVYSVTGLQPLANLVQPIPLVFPIDWSTEAFLDNI